MLFSNQDEEVLNQIQSTILQVQEDCEKLNATTGNLVEDHHQKQKEISVRNFESKLAGGIKKMGRSSWKLF